MKMPTYNDREMKFIKKIGVLYLFMDEKTGIKETFSMPQLMEIDKDIKKVIVKNNIKKNIAYYQDINKKNDFKMDKLTNGEMIYLWLTMHPNKTVNEIADALYNGNHRKVAPYIRIFNKNSGKTGKHISINRQQILRHNQKYWRNIYHAEEIR